MRRMTATYSSEMRVSWSTCSTGLAGTTRSRSSASSGGTRPRVPWVFVISDTIFIRRESRPLRGSRSPPTYDFWKALTGRFAPVNWL